MKDSHWLIYKDKDWTFVYHPPLINKIQRTKSSPSIFSSSLISLVPLNAQSNRFSMTLSIWLYPHPFTSSDLQKFHRGYHWIYGSIPVSSFFPLLHVEDISVHSFWWVLCSQFSLFPFSCNRFNFFDFVFLPSFSSLPLATYLVEDIFFLMGLVDNKLHRTGDWTAVSRYGSGHRCCSRRHRHRCNLRRRCRHFVADHFVSIVTWQP